MSDELVAHHRAARLADATVAEGDGRTLIVQLIAWDTPAEVTDDGRTFYTEEFARGGLRPVADAPMLVRTFSQADVPGRHRSAVVGRLVSTEDRDDGLYGEVRIADTAEGRDLLALRREGVVDALSVEFDDTARRPRAGERVRRTAATLTGLQLTPFPQHPSSRVLAARSNPPQEPTMADEHDDTTTDEDHDDATDVDESGEHQADAQQARSRTPAPARHQRSAPRPGRGAGVGRFRSFGEFAIAAARGDMADDELDRYHRALADLTTPTQTGVVHEEWIRDVIDLYNVYTPTVNAFGTRPLPPDGMQISQPKVTARGTGPTKQVTQKTEVASSQKTIGKVTWDVETYGEGNDISLQLLQRSNPEYITELMRIYTGWMAEKINTDVVAALVAAADDTHAALEYTTAAAFDDLVIDAAALILGNTGLHRFPEVMALSTNLWRELGKLDATDGRPKYPHLNPMNQSGRFNVTDGQGELRGLDWYVEPALVGGSGGIGAVIGVKEAFRTFQGPMGTLTADVPARLGRDIAVYQMVAYGAVDTRGLVSVVNVTP